VACRFSERENRNQSQSQGACGRGIRRSKAIGVAVGLLVVNLADLCMSSLRPSQPRLAKPRRRGPILSEVDHMFHKLERDGGYNVGGEEFDEAPRFIRDLQNSYSSKQEKEAESRKPQKKLKGKQLREFRMKEHKKRRLEQAKEFVSGGYGSEAWKEKRRKRRKREIREVQNMDQEREMKMYKEVLGEVIREEKAEDPEGFVRVKKYVDRQTKILRSPMKISGWDLLTDHEKRAIEAAERSSDKSLDSKYKRTERKRKAEEKAILSGSKLSPHEARMRDKKKKEGELGGLDDVED